MKATVGKADHPDARADEPGSRTVQRWVMALVLGALVLVVGAAVLVGGRGRTAESPDAQPVPAAAAAADESCEAPEPRPEDITAEQLAEAEARIQTATEEYQRTGWWPFKAQSLVDGSWVCGWHQPIRDFAGLEAAVEAGTTAGIPGLPVEAVHAKSGGGEILGYTFGMGFVPAELVGGGSFDIAGALAERYGCNEATEELASCLGYEGLSRSTAQPASG